MSDASTSPLTTSAKPSWTRRLYLKMEALASTRYALAAMLAVSVVDGSFFPVPPFALLVPMVLAQPKAWVRLAVLGTVFSIAGGFLGYYFGVLIHDGAMSWMNIDLDARIHSDRLGVDATLGELLTKNFWFLALLCSILPTPFKVVAIGAGMTGVSLESFFLAAVLGRSARFFGVAGALRFVGPTARRWLRV
ncbi:MAG: DedA family protein [Myxococcaceae bacterium]|nr:DedA family protein [Myxococcaceae bacterium]MCI0669203.1 DedA family protein [Myxococcaceae bacterium]